MTPKLSGIDHVHVYVSSWQEAEEWYKNVLGFKRVDALMAWSMYFSDPFGNCHEITTSDCDMVSKQLA